MPRGFRLYTIIAISTIMHHLHMSTQSTLLDDTLVPKTYLAYNKDDDELPSAHGSDDLADLAGEITQDDIKTIRRIGAGGFGTVFILEHRTLGKLALKRLNESGDVINERRRARREGKLWRGLKHPHVLDFMGVLESATFFCFVCPYQKNGSLDKYIQANPNVDRIQMITECVDALCFLHEQNIIHGDIKAANVLVSDDVHALLCDFGLSRSSENATSTAVHGTGSIRWMSPELLFGQGKSFASDVWAVGMLIYEILSGTLPYNTITASAALVREIAVLEHLPPSEPVGSPDGRSYKYVWELVAKCWKVVPDERLSMATLRSRLVAQPDVLPKVPQEAPATSNSHPGPAVSPPPTLVIRNNVRDETLDGTTLRSILDLFRPRRERGVLLGHKAPISCVAFSPDSRTLASASYDDTVRLWDVAQGVPLGKPLKGHNNNVNSVAFSPDGTTLVSGSKDGTLRVWSVSTGRTIGEPLTGHIAWVWSVSFSPDGRTIASGSSDNTIRIWDAVSRRCIAVLEEGYTAWVMSVAFSPNGKTLVSCSADGTVRRWDMPTYAQIGEPMRGHTSVVVSVVFSPDGSTIASGSLEKTVRLWDARFGEPKGSPLEGHTHFVHSVAFHPNGRLLAAGSFDKTIRIWDLATEPPTTRLMLKDHTRSVESVAFSPDGKWLASGSADRTVRLWDLELLLGTI